MEALIDLRVAELLASRLCHDLVGPVGAVNNGLELLEDEPEEDLLADAVSLLSASAGQASAVLQFYRLAYGYAGHRIEAEGEMLYRLASEYLQTVKTGLVWPRPVVDETLPEGTGKLLLNVVSLAAESLPRGGDVEVRQLASDEGLEVMARGRGARLRQESRAALSARNPEEIAALTPRSVQAYFTALLARGLGGSLDVQDGPDEADSLRFTVVVLSKG